MRKTHTHSVIFFLYLVVTQVETCIDGFEWLEVNIYSLHKCGGGGEGGLEATKKNSQQRSDSTTQQ